MVFEGTLDFLSALAYFRKEQAAANVLVLNSVALVARGAEIIRAYDVSQVSTCLDHDRAGREA